jgi:hypothetical protein
MLKTRSIKPRFDIPEPHARFVEAIRPGRRARINLDGVTPRKVFDTSGEVGRHSESRPPPHKDGVPEYQVIHELPTAKGRAFRLWAKNEIK